MADQTSVIVGLAVGLAGGLAFIVGLVFCVYHQHRKMKRSPGEAVSPSNADIVATSPSSSSKDPEQKPAAQTSLDLNPETGQPLPVALERDPAAQQPIFSPLFFQPSLAFNPAPGAPNPFANRLYPAPEGIPYGNDALPPQRGPPPFRLGRFGCRESTSWLAPPDQFGPYHPYTMQNLDQPSPGEVVQRSSEVPLGSGERVALSDGEQLGREKEQRKKKEKKKKKKSDRDIQVVVEKSNKFSKRRSRHHSDSNSSSDSSSSSGGGSGSGSSSSDGTSSSDSDSSTESVKKLKIGMDSLFLLEGGRKGGKKRHRKRRRIIAVVPQYFPTQAPPPPQPAPVQPAPPPPPPPPPPPAPEPSPPQPMVFIIPGCQQQQPAPPRAPEFEVRPVALPPQNLQGTSAFFKAGGGSKGGTSYETQERTAQIGDEPEYGGNRPNIQVSFGAGAVGFSGGNFSRDCTSCDAGGFHGGVGSGGGARFARANGGAAGSGGGSGDGAGSHGVGHINGEPARGSSRQTGSGYEESGYTMNF